MYTLTRTQLIKIRDIVSEAQEHDTTQIIAILNDCLIDNVEQIEIME